MNITDVQIGTRDDDDDLEEQRQLSRLTAQSGIDGVEPKASSRARTPILSKSRQLRDVNQEQLKNKKSGKGMDIFLSHLQRNGQDAIIAMRMYLKQAHPGIKTFIDLEVDMKGDLSKTLHDAVKNCSAFLFFITDGILASKWCAQEIRWAVEYKKNIILVRETDERHGAIDMKDFFAQVPEDLMEVFQNIIAIPWYRQPAYRDVSVKSILKAAQLEDTYKQDCEHLSKTRSKLEALVENEGEAQQPFAFRCIETYSVGLKIVFFMGGFYKSKNKSVNMLYNVIFNVSFWFCGMLCFLNLLYKAVPYHIVSTDLLTAYVHLPAWQGWRAWRKYVQSAEGNELLSRVQSRPDCADQMAFYCRLTGWLVLAVQMVMVADVLMAFSMPNAMGHMDAADPGRWGFLRDVVHWTRFADWHARIMFVVIPPVIASLFASYSMFAIISGLHMLDVEILKETMGDCAHIAARFQLRKHHRKRSRSNLSANEDQSNHSDAGDSQSDSCAGEDMEGQLRWKAMEENMYESMLDITSLLMSNTQRRMDHTCNICSSVWIHLVAFSSCQVLAICNGFRSHANGYAPGGGKWDDYRWWFGCQDVFHLSGGLLLLFVAMLLFCMVTGSFMKVPMQVVHLFQEARAPLSRQAQMSACLTGREYGMHILRQTVFIDAPKATLFFIALLLMVADHVMALMNMADAVP